MTNIIQFLHTTAAYQSAALQLMVGEANLAARQLDLHESQPFVTAQNTNEWNVSPPPMGVGGSILSPNYIFEFRKGQLAWVNKIDWLKKVSPPITNLVELSSRPSLLDSNSAYQLATQWLGNLSLDVAAMERKYPLHVFQVPAQKTDARGRNLPGVSNNVPIPLYKISWGERTPPMDSFNPVRVEILGTTKELLQLRIQDASLFGRRPLTVTNAVELLGPLPPPRHFVEQLVGGKDAYETIANPERADAWLLKTYEQSGSSTNKAPRTGATRMNVKTAKQFTEALLDFDTYAWTVQKMCLPDFGARLRFTRGNNSVEFLLCYECDILVVTHNGRTHAENFDYGHNKLVRALQAVFPKDNIVKKLDFNADKPEELLKIFQSQ